VADEIQPTQPLIPSLRVGNAPDEKRREKRKQQQNKKDTDKEPDNTDKTDNNDGHIDEYV
jgi:hypothetical protein